MVCGFHNISDPTTHQPTSSLIIYSYLLWQISEAFHTKDIVISTLLCCYDNISHDVAYHNLEQLKCDYSCQIISNLKGSNVFKRSKEYGKIRQIGDKTKICFMTAYEEYYNEFKRIFPDLQEGECFIRKPIGMDDLIKTVKSHLNYN